MKNIDFENQPVSLKKVITIFKNLPISVQKVSINPYFLHGWLDTAVLLHCRSVVLRQMKLFAATELA